MTMNTYIFYGNELWHHGVAGQKWGQRRYQNADGSYKPGAEGRYSSVGKAIKRTAHRVGATFKKAKEVASAKREAKKAAKEDKKFNNKRVLVAAALAAYGGYRLVKSGKLDSALDAARGLGKKEVGTALSTISTKGLNEIVIDKRPKQLAALAGAGAAAGMMAYNKAKNRSQLRNRMDNDANDYDEEFANSKQGKKLGKEYSKHIDKIETSENLTREDEDKFYKAEEDYLRASSRYQGKKLLEKYGKKDMETYLKSRGVAVGKDLVKSYEDYDWQLHTY